MILHVVSLFCDVCEDEESDFTEYDAYSVRAVGVKHFGWTFINGEDICPACTTKAAGTQPKAGSDE